MLQLILRLQVGLNRLQSARRMQQRATIAIQSDEAKGRVKHGKYYSWQGYRLKGGNDNSPQFQGQQHTVIR